MERIPQTYTRKFGRRLYTRAAIKEIYGLLGRSSETVECEVGHYRIDNIGELDAVDLESVDSISFSVGSGRGFRKGGVNISIYPLSCIIRVADDHDATGMGLAAQIAAVVLRLRRSAISFLEPFGAQPRSIGFIDPAHRSTFWSRKKDDIIFWIISGLVGAAVTNIDRLWALAKGLGRH